MSADSETAFRFGAKLRTWRRQNNLKQASLAHQLGVSQPAIARWEKGVDMPSPAMTARIHDLMAQSSNRELAMQKILTERTGSIRALFDFEDMRLLAVSSGFREVWPEFSEYQGISLRDDLVNEVAVVSNDRHLRKQILEGSVGLITGVSVRHTRLQVDTSVRHKWHASFRRFGPRVYVDMLYESCAQDLSPGLIDIVRYDEGPDLIIGEGTTRSADQG
jgi:transcriptional regulator with XRE-family HTH domain